MKALESVVLLSVNAEDSLGAPLAATHTVRNYPTWVLMDAKGGIVDRWLGYEKTHFLETLAEGIADPVTIDQRLARFETAPSSADAARLARYQASRREYREGVRLYREAQRLDASASRDYSEPIFDLMTRGLSDSLFTPDELLAAAQAVLASPRRTPRSLLQMAGALQRAAASLGDRAFGADAVQAACDATADETRSGVDGAAQRRARRSDALRVARSSSRGRAQACRDAGRLDGARDRSERVLLVVLRGRDEPRRGRNAGAPCARDRAAG